MLFLTSQLWTYKKFSFTDKRINSKKNGMVWQTCIKLNNLLSFFIVLYKLFEWISCGNGSFLSAMIYLRQVFLLNRLGQLFQLIPQYFPLLRFQYQLKSYQQQKLLFLSFNQPFISIKLISSFFFSTLSKGNTDGT